jgi:hypothetical protein
MLHARFRRLRGHASGAAQIARSPTSCVDSTAAVRVQPSQLQCYPAHFGRHRHGTLLFACRVQQHTVRPSAVSKAVNRVKQSDAACAHTCACCGPHTNPVCRIRPKLQRPGYVAVSTSTVIPACTSSCFRRSQWMSVSPRPVGLAASAYTAFRIC